ncbi:endothelin-converting enzyme 1-like [Haemaphysalis longicornis]
MSTMHTFTAISGTGSSHSFHSTVNVLPQGASSNVLGFSSPAYGFSCSAPRKPPPCYPPGQETTWDRRSITQNCTVGTALMLLIASVLLLVLLFVLIPNHPLSPVCTTDACSKYSRLLKLSMNTSADPCHSFTRFVCDGWRANSSLSVRHHTLLAALNRIALTANETSSPKHDRKGPHLASVFYRSCDRVRTGEKEHVAEVKAALLNAGITWPRRKKEADVLRTLLYASLKLRWNAALNVQVETNAGRTGIGGASSVVVTLTASGDFRMIAGKYLLRKKKASRESKAYFEFLSKQFSGTTLEATTGVAATADVQDEGQLVDFGFNDEVEDIMRHGDDTMHLFLSWYTVQIAALFASQGLVGNFYGTPDEARLGHGGFCLSRTYRLFGAAALSAYLKGLQVESMRAKFEPLALSVRQTFLHHLMLWKHWNSNSSMVANWNSTDVFTGFLKSPDDLRLPQDSVTGRTNMSDSFLENWLNATVPPLEAVTGIPLPWSSFVVAALEGLDSYARVSYDVALLPYAFEFPLYGTTNTVNYAGVGNQLAYALSEAIYGSYYDSDVDGGGTQPLTAFVRCVRFERYAGRNPKPEPDVLEVLALKPLVDAFQHDQPRHVEYLIGYEGYSPLRLFFLAFCYARCAGSRSHPTAKDTFDCDDILRHSVEFSQEFECPLGSPMNPPEKCQLFS